MTSARIEEQQIDFARRSLTLRWRKKRLEGLRLPERTRGKKTTHTVNPLCGSIVRGLLRVPSNQIQNAIVLLDQCGAALHPIAIVDVKDRTDHAMVGFVSMPADDAIDLEPARSFEHAAIFEIDHVMDRVLNPAAE